MIRILVERYLDLGMKSADFLTLFYMLEEEEGGALQEALGAKKSKRIKQMDDDERAQFLITLSNASELCAKIGLPLSGQLLAQISDDPPQTQREFNMLVRTIRTELADKVCLCLPQHLAPYYESDDLVSDKVRAAFPSASSEIRNAGDALATGLSTACVFHAMRAAEIGVRVLGTALQIQLTKPIELSEWQVILNGISGAIRNIENQAPTLQRDEDLAFYGTAAAQFRFFKDGWRIRVAHARASYNESQAKEAIDHVRSFFEILAERLAE